MGSCEHLRGIHFKNCNLNKLCKIVCREKSAYVERLALLEDESSAVKLSLIQLLQDKAAVNKHLAMENSQLQRQLTVNTTYLTIRHV